MPKGLTCSSSGLTDVSTAEPVFQTTTSGYQWDVSCNQPYIIDEWSGLSGLSSADPSLNWNAPAEEWEK